MIQEKTVADSRTEQVHILFPSDSNGRYRLFGGKLMEWIDVVAAVVARRHAQTEVTTATVDSLRFEAPAYVNNTIILVGRLTYVGNTSMEVRVDTYLEALDGVRERINTAFLVMVSIDQDEKPVRVPRLRLVSDEERTEWAAAERRNALRRQRRHEQY
ncbi:MAG TPA: acyl-CoA thioesterase [Clostridia bacterium]|nr:acyl-CoA thioesterase [Clostridia bacterium]